MKENGCRLEYRDDFIPTRRGIPRFREMSRAQQEALIREDPRFGTVVCRCETVTEGEIVSAIRRPLGARSVDAVKRRVRAGMGRCQGGFCGPKVLEILSRELGLPVEQITKNEPGSRMAAGRMREGGDRA
jgi:glycerol-3-phosphate dehydrogenase